MKWTRLNSSGVSTENGKVMHVPEKSRADAVTVNVMCISMLIRCKLEGVEMVSRGLNCIM